MTSKFDEAPRNGLCRGHDTNKWFPVFGPSPTKEERKKNERDTAEAVLICSKCEQQHHCLEYSLRHEPYGIWGGKTELERANLRNARKIILTRDARIFFPGIGTRNANGNFSRPEEVGAAE
jgi:hypothetical protein